MSEPAQPQNRLRRASPLTGKEPPAKHRFPKGRSGNPGGRPSHKPLTEAYRRIGAMTERELEAFIRKAKKAGGLTRHDAAAIGLFKAAARGHTPAAKEIADRIEGRVPLTVKGELDVGNSLRRAIELVNERRRGDRE